MSKYVRKNRFAEITGYTKKAVDQKIYNGVWVEGIHYYRAPDRNILIDMEEYERWVEQGSSQGLRVAANQ